jgi:hypothetical protein
MLVSSVPLSLTTVSGRPRLAMMASSSRTTGDPTARCRRQRQAFPRVVVHHGQHPEASAIGEAVADEVEAPALVGSVRHQHRPPGAQRPLATTALAHLQLLLAIEPPELLDVHLDALPLQHHVDTAIAEPTTLRRHGLHRLPQLHIVGPSRW